MAVQALGAELRDPELENGPACVAAERLDALLDGALADEAMEQLDTFVRGALAAGPNLTRAGFAQATANLGPLDLGNMNAAAFRPGKYDAPETVRATRWELGCTCYKPIGDFVVAEF